MYDLVALGEVLLRLAIPAPARFETARQLDVQIGGAEANVAAACARLGLRTAWISALPDNAWGDRIRRELSAHGVDTAHVRATPGARVGVYFLEYGAPPRPVRVLYDRRDSAFGRLTAEEVDWEPLRRARVLREASTLSFDVNYRTALWMPDESRAFVEHALPIARHVFLGREEAEIVLGLTGPPEQMLEAIARLAPKATVALMQGEEGATVLAGGRLWRPSRRLAVQVVDPIGAGDAFVAGFLWATLNGRGDQDVVDAANAVAALKCSTWGDVALVTPRDVEDALAGGSGVRR